MSTLTGQSALQPLQARHRSRACRTSVLRQPSAIAPPRACAVEHLEQQPRPATGGVLLLLGDHVRRAHHPALVAAALPDTDAAQHGPAEAAFVLGVAERGLDAAVVVVDAQAQQRVERIRRRDLAGVHPVVRVEDRLEPAERLDDLLSGTSSAAARRAAGRRRARRRTTRRRRPRGRRRVRRSGGRRRRRPRSAGRTGCGSARSPGRSARRPRPARSRTRRRASAGLAGSRRGRRRRRRSPPSRARCRAVRVRVLWRRARTRGPATSASPAPGRRRRRRPRRLGSCPGRRASRRQRRRPRPGCHRPSARAGRPAPPAAWSARPG